MKNTFIININNNKLTLTADQKIDLIKYKLLRSNGFLYSNYTKEYIFNGKLETAIKELKDIQNNKLNNNYSLNRDYSKEEIAEHKKELSESIYIYFNDEIKEKLESIYNNYLKEKEIQEKEKDEKEKHADQERTKRFETIIKNIKLLKNNFSVSTYDIAMSNCNMSELLTRTGVKINIHVKDYLLRNNLNNYIHDKITEGDILQISIYYRASYYSSQKTLKLCIDHYTADSNSNFMSGGSGHYNSNIELFKTNRINFKDVIKATELMDAEVIKSIVLHYVNYTNGLITYKSGINSLGMITEHLTNNEHLQNLKAAFNQ